MIFFTAFFLNIYSYLLIITSTYCGSKFHHNIYYSPSVPNQIGRGDSFELFIDNCSMCGSNGFHIVLCIFHRFHNHNWVTLEPKIYIYISFLSETIS